MAAPQPADAGRGRRRDVLVGLITVVVEIGAILGFVGGRFIRRFRGTDQPA
jgi:hypothetical protein